MSLGFRNSSVNLGMLSLSHIPDSVKSSVGGVLGQFPIFSAVNSGSAVGKALVNGEITDVPSFLDAAASGLPSSAKSVVGNVVGSFGSKSDSGSVSYVPSDGGTVAPVPDYLNADLAKAYGMDASTAYQEALSNTSYQRAFSDMKAAGLNPMVMFSGSGSGAAGVYAPSPALTSTGISTGVSSAAGAHDYYKSMVNVGSVVGALIGAKAGGVRGAYMGSRVGSSVFGAIGNLIDASK